MVLAVAHVWNLDLEAQDRCIPDRQEKILCIHQYHLVMQ